MKKAFKESSRLHLALNTSRFEEAVDFYKALFDLERIKLKPGYAKFEVNDPPINFTLNESTQVSGNRINHLGVEPRSTEHVKLESGRLAKLGLETQVEEGATCCYSKQDKVWVTDPDGNAWETFVVLEDSDLKNDPKRDSTCCSSLEESNSCAS